MSVANEVGIPVDVTAGRDLIGPYRVVHALGTGGEGQIFAVLDTRAGHERRLALKLFSLASPAIDRRVRLEFERLATLDHPSILRAVDVGRHEGRPFLVTEIVAGPSPLEISHVPDDGERRRRLHDLAVGLADGLAYLHGRGVVHGDVSPGNVRLRNDGTPVLLDVGGAVLATPGAAFGTLGFAAPEALVGEVSTATDLFGLGACLFAAWAGAGPFGQGAESVPRLLARPAPLLSATRPGLGADWDALVASLLRPLPNDRPSSARQVLRQLKRLAPVAQDTEPAATVSDELLPPYPGGDVLGGVFVGREHQRAVLTDALQGLARGEAAFSVITLVGPEGAGRRSLVTQALRDHAVDQLNATSRARPVVVFRGSVAALDRWLSTSDRGFEETPGAADPDHQRHDRFGRMVADLERSAVERPVCVVLEGNTGDGGAGAPEVDLASFVAGAPPSGRVLFLLAASRALSRVAALDLELGPLTVADVATLIARAVGEPQPDALVARVVDASGGHAATACHLTRQLVAAVRDGVAERFTPERDVELRHRLAGLFAGHGHAVRRALVCVALGMEPPEAGGWDAAGPSCGLDEAEACGWLVARPDIATAVPSGSGFHLPSAAHEAAVAEALADPDVRDLTALAADRLPDEDGRRGVCLAALGRAGEAIAAFRRAAAAARDQQQIDLGEDCRWLARAFRLGPDDLTVDERVRLGNRLALEGRAAEAEEVLSWQAPRARSGASPAKADLRLDERRAWLRARTGDLEGARALLEDALTRAGDAPESARALARARLARVLFGLQRFPQAVAMARTALADPIAGALAVETSLLAHAYGGDLPGARRLLEALPAPARSSPRSLVLVALVDHLGGELERALEGYRRALGEADRVGDIHTAAAIALNLGALSAESGRYAEALAAQDRAVRELGRIGATAELATALFNTGMLLCELGDLEGARRLAGRLRRELALRTGTASGSATYLDAEIAARAGDETAALDSLRALAAGEIETPPTLRRAAVLAAADLLARAGRHEEGGRLLDTLMASAAPGASPAPEDDPALRLARARVLLATKVWETGAGAGLAERLVTDATGAAKAGRRPAAFRTGLTAARLFHRLGRASDASRSLTSARRSFEEVCMSTPTDHRPGLKNDPDARMLAELVERTRFEAEEGDRREGAAGGGAERAAGARTERSEGRLRRLLRINKRLNSELRLPRLLELIMDTVIELTDAERGFLLLEDDDGELIVKVARNIDQQSLDTGGLELSRSIASQAARGGAPIVTIDAAGDPRFRSALSVSDLHLRSVLAVPLQIKGRAAGTVYVDHRLRQGAFSDEDVQLVLDFTEQAAIAIENARLMSELRKRERKIEVLNQRLQGELDVRKEELSGMKQELRENREALAIRYDYRNIVGRTPRMMEMFRLLDRLTDTALPVVVQGESGTGKELVARALHFNGPRRAQAFVSENCAAIPETLLESTLFGAVRGAFTGADHDSRGLFEVADGGTLFLDEVAEMSPGMQGKLLRILQTGELRRVGGERTRKVDVRIVAASNRDLGRMVEEGKFRQDLFFRLSVARILLPPLRERREDIPAIVAHLLGKIATSLAMAPSTAGRAAGRAAGASVEPHPKRMDPQALARLCAYRWPGNVRELENELMRAVALSGDVIGVDDLSVHVAGTAEAALTSVDDPDNLALRPRVERLERALLREALSRHGGNQTKAAVALGLSRFGLQKKLRRYGFA